MTSPWTPLTPVVVLGNLPMRPGTVAFPLPSVLPVRNATGLLVFAWCALGGSNPALGYWHVASTVAPGVRNWFSLMGVGSVNATTTAFNSQAFWLPMPADGELSVTLTTPVGQGFASPANRGQVEIHGYTTAGG